MPVSAKQFDELVRDMPGFGRDPASIRRRIEMMEAVLEGLFVIPGTKRRVGLDSLVGLVPVVGDIATAAMGAWIVWEARNLGLSKWQLTRMAANVGVDTLVGAIPFAGDIFDFLYKSNTKNLRIIRKHLDRHHPSTVTIDG
ncbi:DUF4112 domain-containing protein [Sphingobium sp. WTD-1]|jgi:hypothetical protein|uniref:DUF4112 domain-containing protein n=1 Tax=Sphingobium sp. WTD-1 TaxID=2979467 RepID=UPI0024DED169|nr:DUF4112 domain-containing protein [Sphingobium sp. WTD-1]WIA55978.1 DUF4112 domain-containing protein [Sphingobium sp. WTD-1]